MPSLFVVIDESEVSITLNTSLLELILVDSGQIHEHEAASCIYQIGVPFGAN
jgi:hypothetical protein